MKTFGKSMLSALGLAALLAAPAARAGDIGGSLFATGGEVTIRFEGSNALYNSLISVNGSSEIFPNHGTTIGTEFSLGSFSAGTALDVVLHVLDTGLFFHTGTGGLNPDGLAHASISVADGRVFVSFEDLAGGGDHDFNDHMFSLTNVVLSPAPEPSVYAMLAAGLGVLGFVGRRRKT
ncbi:MAG TPA: DUF4114 domain-containing protein [Albitalea sp.]|uniref:DUF4114 domain-containing protein n=1 Tax=Piscinibacter sp. TaxID=1903157 RepID=UPI002ED5F711